MKKICIIILFILPSLLVAQNIKNKHNNLCLGFYFSPDHSYRKLTSDSLKSVRDIKNWRNTHENPKIGYTTGLSLLIDLTDKVQIESGILYSEKGEKISGIFLYLSESADPRLNNLYDTSLIDLYAVGFNYMYHYIDIPTKINYTFIEDDLKIFVSLGISTNFFINHKITTYQYFEDNKFEKNTTKNSYYKFNSINFSILVGMGLEYEINELLKLKIEPIYRRSINSIIDAPIKSHLFSIGLGTALYYKF